MNETSSFQSTGGQRLVQWWNGPSRSKLQGCLEQRWTQLRSLNCSDDEMKRPHSHILPQFCTLPECYLSAHPSLSPPPAGRGVAGRTVMPFTPALGQEVCVWVSPSRLCWDEHATAPDLCYPPWRQRKSKRQRQTGMWRALVISSGLKLSYLDKNMVLPKGYSVFVMCPVHFELNVKLCLFILD